MEDLMLIRSTFMQSIISGVINKFLHRQAPGINVYLKDIMVKKSDDKEQRVKIHLELDAEMTGAQLRELLKKVDLL